MPISFSSSIPGVRNALIRAEKRGKVRRLASKIYTDDLTSAPEEVIRRHRLEIAAHFYPSAVVSHRSALENSLSPASKLHLTVQGAVAPIRILPGLEIRLWKGPPPQPEDPPVAFGDKPTLFMASQPRALLENLQIARARVNDEPKILTQEALERWLDRQLRSFGGSWLDDTQRQVDAIADRLGWQREKTEFEALATALRGKGEGIVLISEVAKARAQGRPYDPDRDLLFRNLQARLANETFQELPAPPVAERENRAFWEAYFSNYIEGTKFTVEDAQTIVFSPTTSPAAQKRPADAHDVLETYRLIVDNRICSDTPSTPADFLDLLKRRHARMMASRPYVHPGVFKSENNQVGSRVFVRPELVVSTLERAWPIARSLRSPTARALFVLFVLAEVHPFNDGNGRISRLGMNAELDGAHQMRLIFPTALRTDYLGVLEALTIRQDPEPYIRFSHKLIDMNSRMPFQSFEASHEFFKKTGALDENLGPSMLAGLSS